ncbi:MAG: aryl-sulfate sulfotransferase [Planctomycetota bacterium]|nr:aryl-sulfate sulfotransferase [Planctomycetota bacterium]
MKKLLLCLGLGFGLAPSLHAQVVWTDEQLEAQMQGFKQSDTLSSLQTLSTLLKQQESGFLAISNRIHGNHAEYLLRIEKLLDDLSNERWEVREKAEDTLAEIGAKGRELILARSKAGETAEERIRASRALTVIDESPDTKEELEKRYLRGLALTSLYMDTRPKLVKALGSALQHTDPLIVNQCVRALGVHGDDDQAKKLIALLANDGQAYGRVIRSTLAVMKGTAGRDFIVGLLLKAEVDETEAVQLLRILREKTDGKATLSKLQGSENAVIVDASRIKMPAVGKDSPIVQVSLADQTIVEGRLVGYWSDSVRLTQPSVVKGKERTPIAITSLTFPLQGCDGIKVVGSTPIKTVNKCRMFLVQGTLVTGTLTAVGVDTVTLESETFGRMTVKRSLVQGLAIDPKLDRLLGASAKHDKVRLKSNKLINGTVKSLDKTELVFLDGSGKETRIPRADIAGLLFKRPLHATVETRTFTRVTLNNGDKVLGHIAALHGSHLGIVAPGVGTAVLPTNKVVEMEFGMGGGAMWGFTLVADYSDNRIVEFDDQGREVFAIEEIFGVWDVECLDNGNLLITEFSVNRVSEVTRENKVVWSFEDLKNPYDADRLPNGNTLIADTFGRRVIEVNPKGKIVWSFAKDIHPYDVDRLPNGNTLIADTRDDRVIEIDPKGKIIWQIKNVPNVHDADRLPNGNTLLTIRMLNEIREVDASGKTVMTLKDLSSPSDADRLPNGNTLVAENGFIREFDRHGREVWKKAITWAVEVNRY